MAAVLDVAQFILEQTGPVTATKLQKLVYYCQAWALVWTDAPLFGERIEAWANGPASPALFKAHEGVFQLDPASSLGDSARLSEDEKAIIRDVLKGYADKSAQWLVELSRMEEPWKTARAGTPPGKRCSNEITHAAMAEYYSGL